MMQPELTFYHCLRNINGREYYCDTALSRAIYHAKVDKDTSELEASLRSGYELTLRDRELLADYISGKLNRRGRPRKEFLDMFDPISRAVRDYYIMADEYRSMVGKRHYGWKEDLINQIAARYKVNPDQLVSRLKACRGSR